MIVILTGPPGAGKGTQAALLVERKGFRKLSTGDALRSQIKLGSEIGKLAQGFMEAGKLVPNEVLRDILLAELDVLQGKPVLLDGYPRNVAQVETLDTLKDRYPVIGVASLLVPDRVLLDRITGRRVCDGCGLSYHIEYSPPKSSGVCDKCGSRLFQRPDDSEAKVATRLKVYGDETRPILDLYRRRGLCVDIDGVGDAEDVYKRLSKAVESFAT